MDKIQVRKHFTPGMKTVKQKLYTIGLQNKGTRFNFKFIHLQSAL